MRSWAIAALLTALGFSAAAPGQDPQNEKIKVGDWAPDVEAKEWVNANGTLPASEVPSLREYRGLVTLLVFWVSHQEGGRYLLPYINIADYGGRFGGSGLAVIGLTDADRKRTEDWLRESKVFFPVGCESKAAEDYGITVFPSIVIVDPEGKVAYKGPVSNDLFNTIADIQEKTPPTRTNPEEAARAARWLDEAREQIREGSFRRAYVLAADAWLHTVLGDRLKSEAFAFSDVLELLAADELAKVRPLIDEQKYKDAAAILMDVRKRFRGTEASRDAKALIDTYSEKFDAFKSAVSSFGDERTAAKLLLEAREDVRLHRFGDAHAKLERIRKEFASTEAAGYAEDLLARMNANPIVRALVREKQAEADCRTWLAQARGYLKTGRIREARELFDRVLNTYPDTSFAQEAKEELIRMPP